MWACGPGRVLDPAREGGALALSVREGVITGKLLKINTAIVSQKSYCRQPWSKVRL